MATIMIIANVWLLNEQLYWCVDIVEIEGLLVEDGSSTVGCTICLRGNYNN